MSDQRNYCRENQQGDKDAGEHPRTAICRHGLPAPRSAGQQAVYVLGAMAAEHLRKYSGLRFTEGLCGRPRLRVVLRFPPSMSYRRLCSRLHGIDRHVLRRNGLCRVWAWRRGGGCRIKRRRCFSVLADPQRGAAPGAKPGVCRLLGSTVMTKHEKSPFLSSFSLPTDRKCFTQSERTSLCFPVCFTS